MYIRGVKNEKKLKNKKTKISKKQTNADQKIGKIKLIFENGLSN